MIVFMIHAPELRGTQDGWLASDGNWETTREWGMQFADAASAHQELRERPELDSMDIPVRVVKVITKEDGRVFIYPCDQDGRQVYPNLRGRRRKARQVPTGPLTSYFVLAGIDPVTAKIRYAAQVDDEWVWVKRCWKARRFQALHLADHLHADAEAALGHSLYNYHVTQTDGSHWDVRPFIPVDLTEEVAP